MCDPMITDIGPDPEWYWELRETQGRPWPLTVAMTRANHAALADRRAAAELKAALAEWTCPACGGPRECPDLPSTLAYRSPTCGYAEVAGGRWAHGPTVDRSFTRA